MSERPPSLATHLGALAALGGLLILSVVMARFRLGLINVIAGPAIAALKALVVLLVFMRLRGSKPAIYFAASFGILWLAILFGLTLAEVLTRTPVVVLP